MPFGSQDFSFQSCDVAKVVIIHKMVLPNLAKRKYEMKKKSNILVYFLQLAGTWDRI
jgi:hypothetical protein